MSAYLVVPADAGERVGIDIVRQIAENSGVDGSVIVGKLLDSDDTGFGYGAQKGEFTDLAQGRHHRSGQGRPHRLSGRGLHRRPDDHDRGAGREQAERQGFRSAGRRRLLRHTGGTGFPAAAETGSCPEFALFSRNKPLRPKLDSISL